ncbi:MAG: DNA gyrase inhibitor YacG [Alphaproteobacteria bacterium]|nr:DNA gyrase inhibitor YacG [Alphaproteobacteria bacterium]
MDDLPRPKPVRPCPICGKPAGAKFRPFCSERCALVDLGRWFTGSYRVPTDEKPEDAAPDARAGDAGETDDGR